MAGDIKSSSEERIRLSLLLADLYADEGLERLEEEVYLRLLTEFPHSADIQTYYGNFLVKQGMTAFIYSLFIYALYKLVKMLIRIL